MIFFVEIQTSKGKYNCEINFVYLSLFLWDSLLIFLRRPLSLTEDAIFWRWYSEVWAPYLGSKFILTWTELNIKSKSYKSFEVVWSITLFCRLKVIKKQQIWIDSALQGSTQLCACVQAGVDGCCAYVIQLMYQLRIASSTQMSRCGANESTGPTKG